MIEPNYEPLWHWVKTREHARQEKEKGLAWPFCDDAIINTYRFCNVRREDDRVTIWIRQNIREKFKDHQHLWFMLCAARQINWPPTLDYLIDIACVEESWRDIWPVDDTFKPQAMADALNRFGADGEKVFTGAYIITAPSTKGAKKTDHVALNTLGKVWAARKWFELLFSRPDVTMQQVHTKLMEYDGWGPFMAYQAVVDMRFTRLLENATDRFHWAAAGPGTIRGLNRLYGRALDFKLGQLQALKEMRLIYNQVLDATGVLMDFSDVPNILCETDKYLRVKNGEGKPRALYVPGRGS